MIPKPDFGDYHKFRASLGLAMMVAGPLLVWFVLREPFDLLTPQAKIESLTRFAQWFVEARQYAALGLLVTSLVTGACLLIYGVRMFFAALPEWKHVQEVHDELLSLERDMKKAGVRSATVEEIAESISVEQAENQASQVAFGPVDDVGTDERAVDASARKERSEDQLLMVRDVEKLFGAKLARHIPEGFTILPNMVVRNRMVDYLLRSGNESYPDVLIEVRAFPDRLSSEVVMLAVERSAMLAQNYALTLKRPTKPLTVVIVPEKEVENIDIETLRHEVEKASSVGQKALLAVVGQSALFLLQPVDFMSMFDADSTGVIFWV